MQEHSPVDFHDHCEDHPIIAPKDVLALSQNSRTLNFSIKKKPEIDTRSKSRNHLRLSEHPREHMSILTDDVIKGLQKKCKEVKKQKYLTERKFSR